MAIKCFIKSLNWTQKQPNLVKGEIVIPSDQPVDDLFTGINYTLYSSLMYYIMTEEEYRRLKP